MKSKTHYGLLSDVNFDKKFICVIQLVEPFGLLMTNGKSETEGVEYDVEIERSSLQGIETNNPITTFAIVLSQNNVTHYTVLLILLLKISLEYSVFNFYDTEVMI